MSNDIEQARAEVEAHVGEALAAWRRAAECLEAALADVAAGREAAQRAYDARREWGDAAKAEGATPAAMVEAMRSMPIPELPARLRTLAGRASSIEALRRELAA